jgi:hypothetical protein
LVHSLAVELYRFFATRLKRHRPRPFRDAAGRRNDLLEAYLGFFFDFFGVSLVVVAGSVVGLA